MNWLRRKIETQAGRERTKNYLYLVMAVSIVVYVLGTEIYCPILYVAAAITAVILFASTFFICVGEALHSCRKFFKFIFTGGLITTVVLSLSVVIAGHHTLTSWIGVYSLFCIIFCIIWVLASLLADAPVAKLANTCTNTVTGIATAIGNFFFLVQGASGTFGLPSELIDLFTFPEHTAIETMQIMFNVVLIGFLCSGLIASLALHIKEYLETIRS